MEENFIILFQKNLSLITTEESNSLYRGSGITGNWLDTGYQHSKADKGIKQNKAHLLHDWSTDFNFNFYHGIVDRLNVS